jgi:thiol-disulfide isomerase/thioredoxin
MRQLTEIDREIAEVKAQLKDVEGTPTEIYTRIVGYYRSLKNWNRGKREEYGIRRTYETELSGAQATPGTLLSPAPGAAELSVQPAAISVPAPALDSTGEETPEYLYFFRQDCPNCKPVRTLLTDLEERGRAVDVDTDLGMQLAMDFQILSTPTVVFLDREGQEARRATAVEDIREAMAV